MSTLGESDLSIHDPNASHRRMQAERAACRNISTEELEKGVVEDMRRALSLAVASDKLPQRWAADIKDVLTRLERGRT